MITNITFPLYFVIVKKTEFQAFLLVLFLLSYVKTDVDGMKLGTESEGKNFFSNST